MQRLGAPGQAATAACSQRAVQVAAEAAQEVAQTDEHLWMNEAGGRKSGAEA